MYTVQRDTKLRLVFGFSILGLIIATYQTYEHYYAISICNSASVFSCARVTESVYGEMPPNSGIATAFWGLLWWVGMLGITSASLRWPERHRNAKNMLLFIGTILGMIVVSYLVYIELILLPAQTGQLAICPFCTLQHSFIVILTGLSYLLLQQPVRETLDTVYSNITRDS